MYCYYVSTIKCFQKSFFLKKMFYSVIYITHVNPASNTFYAIEKNHKTVLK